MAEQLAGAVVVITGASSGVGRAAARLFAQKGAKVVLAARRAELLDQAAQECRGMGAEALAVPTDVGDQEAVQALAQRALDTYGRIDVWVNNAGGAAFGRFEQTPLEDHERVIRTDLLGTLYGAYVALPIFQRQNKGVLINTGSLDSKLSEPYMSSYTAAKHAVAGLGMSLRQEQVIAKTHQIHICTVMPETIDTPFFQHGANYSGRAVQAMPPIVSAERVARTIVSLAERPRREVFVGLAARQFWFQYLLAPGLTERMFAVLGDRFQLSPSQTAPNTTGSLREPMSSGIDSSGGWKAWERQNIVALLRQQPVASVGVSALALLTIGALSWGAWSITRTRSARA